MSYFLYTSLFISCRDKITNTWVNLTSEKDRVFMRVGKGERERERERERGQRERVSE